jgi:hypothetical protein
LHPKDPSQILRKLSVLRFDLQECSATHQSLQWPEGYAVKTTQEVARELSKDVEASHEVVFVDTVSWVLGPATQTLTG